MSELKTTAEERAEFRAIYEDDVALNGVSYSDGSTTMLRFLDDIDTLLACASSPDPASASGWLIERQQDGRPHWLTCAWEFGWTDDADNAIRFCRPQDAEQIASMMENEDVQVTEHLWIKTPMLRSPDPAREALVGALKEMVERFRPCIETRGDEDVIDRAIAALAEQGHRRTT